MCQNHEIAAVCQAFHRVTNGRSVTKSCLQGLKKLRFFFEFTTTLHHHVKSVHVVNDFALRRAKMGVR